MHKTLTQQKLSAPSECLSTDRVVLQVGWVKNRFRHHRTGRNNQRLKHDAILEWHYTYSLSLIFLNEHKIATAYITGFRYQN